MQSCLQSLYSIQDTNVHIHQRYIYLQRSYNFVSFNDNQDMMKNLAKWILIRIGVILYILEYNMWKSIWVFF